MAPVIDELLGRAELKAEIEELEEQVERLSGQLEGAQERRREAVRDRQAAEERVNRLEDRIADLEGQLERARDGERAVQFRGRDRVRGERLDEALSRLESVRTAEEGAFTAMVGERPDEATREAFGDRAPLVERAAPCLAVTDDVGLVSAALRPPLPPEPFSDWAAGFRIDREWFHPAEPFALALVRSDVFAYATFDGDGRGEIHGFESDVHGDHSKGGFSQARFERRRDEQIEGHIERCREAIAERDPDRLIVVGERTVIDEFEDEAVATEPVDATGDPEAALADAYRSFFTAELFLL